jgi:hypothetical protein
MFSLTSARLGSPQNNVRMPLLVPEVVDLIVDELRDDTSALMECALAATMFRSRTRQHLFEKISLSRCSKQLYASLFSILGNSEVAACVRKLHVHLMDHQKEYNDCAYGKQGIIAILGRLERLEALTLDGVCWSALDNDEQAQLLATTMLPSLRTLHISFFTPPHATFLLKLFKAHQHTLQTVNIRDLKYGPGKVQAPCSAFARATGVRPTEFSWNSCSYDEYLPFSFWSGAFLWTSLVALDLGVDHDPDIQAMQSLLNDVSSTLQHLTFHQTGEPGEIVIWTYGVVKTDACSRELHSHIRSWAFVVPAHLQIRVGELAYRMAGPDESLAPTSRPPEHDCQPVLRADFV